MKNNTTYTTKLCDIVKQPVESCITQREDKEFDVSIVRLQQLPLSLQSTVWYTKNCFSLTIVKKASGKYKSKTDSFDISPGTLFFTRPDLNRQLEWHTLHDVYHLTFSERFLSKYAGVDLFKTFPFLLLETVLQANITDEILEDFYSICIEIEQLSLRKSPFKKNLIANLLTRILLKIKFNFWPNYNPKYSKNASNHILKEFIQNLEEHYLQIQRGSVSIPHRVKDYALMQGIHENYLYTVIKEKTGKVISHWIAEKTILTAKTMLENPSVSIKEVSYRLGFPYISYFSIFFKRHTGLTPKDFRKKTMLET